MIYLLFAFAIIIFFLLLVIIMQERYGHVIGMALERRDLMRLNDKAHPDYWANFSWNNTIEKLHMNFDVAFFGDSITRGSDFQSFFKDKSIINLGYSGDNILGMIRRVEMLKSCNPKKIFVMAGTNDLVHLSIPQYKDRYESLLLSIKEATPQVKIYIESIIPHNNKRLQNTPNTKIQEANLVIQSLAAEYGCTFINIYDLYVNEKNELPDDLTTDGIHLRSDCYGMWADAIKDFIYE